MDTPTSLFARWDSTYTKNPHPWKGDLPAFLVDALPHYRGMKVVDLGAGDGRISLPLLTAGAQVHAVDASAVALASLQEAAKNDLLTTEVADLGNWLPEDMYQLAVMSFVLHFLHPIEAENLVGYMQDAVNPGGFHYLADFSEPVGQDDSRWYKTAEDWKKEYDESEWMVIAETTSDSRVALPQASQPVPIFALLIQKKA
jgi:2-polyprenyl-3-methyl-5-hydroxy-6-metoxy-1,4-benzoquinol methylase